MLSVLDRGRAHGIRHFLFGSTQAVLDALVASLEQRLPGVIIAGTFAPAFGAEDDPESLAAITRSRPDIVWIALGAPKQELWMQRHEEAVGPTLALGVGAAFDFHAETKPRAPLWLQRAGLEWAYRLATEPRRLGLRYLTTNTLFIAAAARELAGRRNT
jgi:N-acetylglucosaminyldiphosphoundecaprenol N-acetyl-beta-D-mannosaminyltransferase